jgi:hypothetical protein
LDYLEFIKMQISLKKLKSLIKEELSAQAPPDAPFGQWAYPKERKLPVEEPDTPLEIAFLKRLKANVSHSNVPLSQEDVDALQNIIDNGYYPNIIYPPKGTNEIYRGMLLDYDEFQNIIGITPSNFGTINKSTLFKPQNLTSSWTKDPDVALGFAESEDERYISVILIASVSDNNGKLVDLEDLYTLDMSLSEMDHESEVIGIGTIKVVRIVYAIGEYINELSRLI